MNFLQKLDVINLSDGKAYTVCETYIEKNITYIMLVENLEDGELSKNIKYAKIIILPTRKFGIEIIKDKQINEYLTKIFLPLFKEDYE